MLDNIELSLELLSVYGEWTWTRRQLDEVFLPMIAHLSQRQTTTDDNDFVIAQVMLGIMGNV